MNWVEFAKSGEIVLGLILSFIALVGAALGWWSRKNRAYADGVKKDLSIHHSVIENRLVKVEQQLVHVAEDMDKVRGDVQRLEKDMVGLARKEDLGEIKSTMAAQGATVSRMENQLDTLYRAALAVASRGDAT